MPVETRRQAAFRKRQEAEQIQSETAQEGNVTAMAAQREALVNEQGSIVIGRSRRRYDVRALDRLSQRTARAGLRENGLEVVQCHEDKDDAVYRFEVQERVCITIANPVLEGEDHQPMCSCGTMPNGRPCKHVYWLLDHVLPIWINTLDYPTVHLDYSEQDGLTVKIPARGGNSSVASLFELLQRLEDFEDFATLQRWITRDNTDEEALRRLRTETANLLSIFQPSGLLPHEYIGITDIEEDHQSRLFRLYSETVANQVERDPRILQYLRNVISPADEININVEKISKSITDILTEFDNATSGPPSPTNIHAVEVCARKLIELTRRTRYFLDTRPEDNPSLRLVLAGPILSMLEHVLDRNVDAYEGMVRPQYIESAAQRNLYRLLIAEPFEGVGDFALDVLDRIVLDQQVATQLEQRLMALGSRLHGLQAPHRYLQHLRNIVQVRYESSDTD